MDQTVYMNGGSIVKMMHYFRDDRMIGRLVMMMKFQKAQIAE